MMDSGDKHFKAHSNKLY